MEAEGKKLRELPTFDPALLKKCRDRGDAMPLMFEWYKHVALTAMDVARISPRQPGHLEREPLHLAILQGLHNRCARLMLSTVKLAHDKKCGETVALIARCIAESALTGKWLARYAADQSFTRFVASAVRTDLKLRDLIRSNVASRGSGEWNIEARMLKSIDRVMRLGNMTEDGAHSALRLPSLEQLCKELGYHASLYVSVQRIGSHAIHGTWSDLLTHYIKEADGEFTLTDNVESVPHSNQLLSPALLVLDALREHVHFALDGCDLAKALNRHFDGIQRGLLEADQLWRPEDFKPVQEGPQQS